MNATVVIPTYWAGDDARANAPGVYDHSTKLNATNPELDRCLASLEQVRDIPRIILLVVCPISATADVSKRVHEIVDAHPTLKVTVLPTPRHRASPTVWRRLLPRARASA
mgnify:FL=1